MNQTTSDEQGQTIGRSEPRRPANGAHEADRRKIEMAHLREVSRNLGTQIEGQIQKRPFVVVGAAAGVGFVAGSLFGSRLGQVLLAAGLGYALKNALGGELGLDRIQAGLEKLAGDEVPR